ncbi:MAG: RHS repeat protein [Oligoflexia bacterium]|nr:RHS repeat protein [Oligoflexia bacterium]
MISKFTDNSDLPLETLDTRGEKSAWKKTFAYDQNNRLSSFSSNLGESYRYEYRYASKDLLSFIKETSSVILQNQETAENISKYQIQTGQGSALGTLIPQDSGYVLQGFELLNPEQIKSNSYSPASFTFSDEKQIILENLKKAVGKPVIEKSESLYKILFSKREYFTENAVQVLNHSFSLEEDLFTVKEIENESNELVTLKSFDAHGEVARYVDQSGAEYKFTRDVLGRLKEIVMPNGDVQQMHYNSIGEVDFLSRTKMPSVSYDYDKLGRLEIKTTRASDKKNSIVKKHKWDNAGRILKVESSVESSDPARVSKSSLKYYYDGYECDLSAANCLPSYEGQKGFLTKVESNDFSKTYIYRADGKLITKITDVLGQKKVKELFDYRNDGVLKGHTITLTDQTNPGNEQKIAVSYQFDKLGRINKILHNDKPIISYQYNNLNKITKVLYPLSNDFINLDYDKISGRNIYWDVIDSGNKVVIGQGVTFNNRGMIDQEKYNWGDSISLKKHEYDQRGFLSNSKDEKRSHSFEYDNIGFLKMMGNEKINLEDKEWRKKERKYQVDSFGRVDKINDVSIAYSSESMQAKKNGSVLAEYVYDEDGNIFIKTRNKNLSEAYFDWGVLDAQWGIIVKIKLLDRTIGLITKNGFEGVISDSRDSYILKKRFN